MVNINGVMRNLAWKSRKEYYARNPEILPKKFSDYHEQFKKLNKAGATPTSYRILNEQNVPIYDQAQYGTCTENSLCAAVMITNAVNGQPIVVLSRLFGYYNALLAQNTLGQDAGSDSATVIATLLQYGVPRESSFPYTQANFINNGISTCPPIEVFSEASNNRNFSWLNIEGSGTNRLNQIKTALLANHTVIFGTQLDNSIFSYVPGTIMGPPTGEIIGGHELTVVSYQIDSSGNESYLIRNSWGTSWGMNGYFWMSASWLGDANLIDGVDLISAANTIIF